MGRSSSTPDVRVALDQHRARIRTYARGDLDSLGGTFHAVSVAALELSPDQLAAIPVRYLNGRDGRYHETPAHPEAI